MTNPNPHGQVPEALIDLIDAYAEARHRCGGIYNARTEAARNAVIEALSGVQALSAAPEAIAKLRHLYQNMVNGAVRDTASAKRIAEGLLAPAIEALERATPPAEQQAAPKAAPGELSADSLRHQNKLLAETLGACILASGIVRKDIDGFTGPELLHFGEDLRSMLEAAPKQEAQEPCPTCVALARTVMLDQVSFDRKPDCYGIRQITDDEGVEEWEDIRTSPDVAREEANDMMATGRGEIYEVVPLYTAPLPAPDCHHRPPCDECAAIAAQGGK